MDLAWSSKEHINWFINPFPLIINTPNPLTINMARIHRLSCDWSISLWGLGGVYY